MLVGITWLLLVMERPPLSIWMGDTKAHHPPLALGRLRLSGMPISSLSAASNKSSLNQVKGTAPTPAATAATAAATAAAAAMRRRETVEDVACLLGLFIISRCIDSP